MRELIWTFTIVAPAKQPKNNPLPAGYYQRIPSPLALACACRQPHLEAAPIYYSQISFALSISYTRIFNQSKTPKIHHSHRARQPSPRCVSSSQSALPASTSPPTCQVSSTFTGIILSSRRWPVAFILPLRTSSDRQFCGRCCEALSQFGLILDGLIRF